MIERPKPSAPPAGTPFAHFQWNYGWGLWEQVVPEAAGEEGVIAAYREPLSEVSDTIGSARCVPPRDDTTEWGRFAMWMGSGDPTWWMEDAGRIVVETANGQQYARVGDWVIRTEDGKFHIGMVGSDAERLMRVIRKK